MANICIICRKGKDEFNSEHVIPATIGGLFEINSVCKSCNTLLSKNIDNPFVQSPYILYLRQQFNLNRQGGNRRIASPYKYATILGENASKYYLPKDGTEALLKPNIVETPINGELQVKVTLSKNDAERVISGILKKYEKYGAKREHMKFEEEQDNKELIQFKITVRYEPLLLAGLKMAYEFAVTTIPEYFNDEWAQIISEFLYGKEHYNKIKSRIESVSNFQLELKEIDSQLTQIPSHIHVILLKHINNLGTVCFVKIFHEIFPYFISDSQYFSDETKGIAIYNNFITKELSYGFEHIEREINVKVNTNTASDLEIRESVIAFLQEGISFTKDGDRIYLETLKTLGKTQTHIDWSKSQFFRKILFSPNELFIKSDTSNTLIPVEALSVLYHIIK